MYTAALVVSVSLTRWHLCTGVHRWSNKQERKGREGWGQMLLRGEERVGNMCDTMRISI